MYLILALATPVYLIFLKPISKIMACGLNLE
jgi:hypothetical protein